MSQFGFQITRDGLSALQAYPIGRDCWHARVVTANANRDGTGEIIPFTGKTGPHGTQVTMIRVLSEDATPAETYRIFVRQPGMTAVRLVWELAISAAMTEDAQDDLFIPSGSTVYASSVGGEDADIYMIGDNY